MHYLFICSIGPVQDFIAAARRSHDLWYGSWMLSELSKAAANALKGQKLIFPAPSNVDDLMPNSHLNVANKIVAIIDEHPQKTGANLQGAINNRLNELKEEAFRKINADFDRVLASHQLDDLVEFYWVSVPYDDENYPQCRDIAESLLSSRKATRNFRQAHGTSAFKSSLDGVRESVIPQNTGARSADTLYAQYRVGRGEELSGIDLLKRWGDAQGRDEFQSTTDMAALSFMMALEEDKRTSLIEDIRRLFENLAGFALDETDGTFFFENRLLEAITESEVQTEFQEQFNNLLYQNVGEKRPKPYYVLLLADGDNMGKAIDAQQTLEDHQRLSQTLSAFAVTAKKIIRNYHGNPVYTGGDDILAYLPLHTALECANELQAEFRHSLSEFKFMSAIEDGSDQSHAPTLSVGIVVAHHMTPLTDVLALARATEKRAKAVSGKHGLAITVSKRSGADEHIQGKFDALYGRLKEMIRLSRRDLISSGTAYELYDLHRRLEKSDLPDKALRREAIRIIKRKKESGGESDINERTEEKMQNWLKLCSVKELAQEMIVAKEFAGAYDLAENASSAEREVMTS
jgi:CRISPR-associated protein Cmr2